jgi:hypothetical protein
MEKIIMDIASNKKIPLFILLLSALLLPYSVFASTVYIDTQHSKFFEGDTILFSVRVDSLNKDINAVEGRVMLDHAVGSVSLIDINTAGSEFSLWPLTPLPSINNTNISFAGGAPGGLNSKDAIIFNIVLKFEKEGLFTLTPDAFSVYLHDGIGTKDTVDSTGMAIEVLPKKPDAQPVDDWSAIISDDTTPPEFIEATISQDAYIFDNQYFVSFFAVDTGSGIAYYEIKEGDRNFVRTESPHILQDQSLKSIVQIKAVDKAGNESIAIPERTLISEISYKIYLLWVLIALVILSPVFWLWRLRVARLKKTIKNER